MSHVPIPDIRFGEVVAFCTHCGSRFATKPGGCCLCFACWERTPGSMEHLIKFLYGESRSDNSRADSVQKEAIHVD